MDRDLLPSPSYQHTQRGTVIRAFVLVIGVAESAAIVWLFTDGSSTEVLFVVLALAVTLVAVFVLAGSLTVTIDGQQLRVAFGVGLIHRTIPIRGIRACHAVRNRWWYGWGIRLTPRGWLWNVSGLDAVEIRYRNGKHFRIGTDQPGRLCDAISAAIQREGGR